MVDHQIHRNQRVDLRRVGAELVDRVAHRRKVDDRRHPGEVLHQHAGRLEGDLVGRLGLRVPGGDRLDVLGGHGIAVLEAQSVLQEDLERVRQPGGVELLLQRVETVDLVVASGYRQGGLREKESLMEEYSRTAAERTAGCSAFLRLAEAISSATLVAVPPATFPEISGALTAIRDSRR